MVLKLVGKIIWETFLWVALLGGVLGVVTGLALLFNSSLVFRIGERMNVWISSRAAMRSLEAPIEVERAVYRWHRLIGVLLLAGAAFTLYVVLLRFKGPELDVVLNKFVRLAVAQWIGKSLRIFLVLVNAAAFVIGAVMFLRPSALKPLEAWANRRYSARQATRAWEIPRNRIDPIVQSNPRVIGTMLTLAGLYVVLVLGYARFVVHLH